MDNFESSKLMNRELNNYFKLNHQLLPKFNGTITKQNNADYLIIEYINGQTLLNIQQLNYDLSTLKNIYLLIYKGKS